MHYSTVCIVVAIQGAKLNCAGLKPYEANWIGVDLLGARLNRANLKGPTSAELTYTMSDWGT